MNKKIKDLSNVFLTKRGFTLVEVLLVIGIIAVLASVVIIAINPAKQLAQSRNTQRWSNVNTILNAIHQYAIDHNGNLPSGVTLVNQEICNNGVATTTCASSVLADIRVLTDNETYFTAIPVDPSCPSACNASGVGYTVKKTNNGRIVVSAPDAELGETISVTR